METGQSGHVDIERALRQMEQRITQKLEAVMAAQDDINAAGQAILGLLTDMQADIAEIGSGVTAIQAALAAMPAAVDTSALDAAVAQIAQAQANLDASAASVANVVPPAPPAP